MSQSHADTHDLDKLSRWHDDLNSEPQGGFPVYAVFLVSGEDRDAHDVFRTFRTSFEERGAGFQHLVIFGQHGVSVTVGDLLSGFGMNPGAIPSLALFTHQGAESVYVLSLTEGDPDQSRNEQSQPWRRVLSQVEKAADGHWDPLDLASLEGTIEHNTNEGTVVKLVGALLADAS